MHAGTFFLINFKYLKKHNFLDNYFESMIEHDCVKNPTGFHEIYAANKNYFEI